MYHDLIEKLYTIQSNMDKWLDEIQSDFFTNIKINDTYFPFLSKDKCETDFIEIYNTYWLSQISSIIYEFEAFYNKIEKELSTAYIIDKNSIYNNLYYFINNLKMQKNNELNRFLAILNQNNTTLNNDPNHNLHKYKDPIYKLKSINYYMRDNLIPHLEKFFPKLKIFSPPNTTNKNVSFYDNIELIVKRYCNIANYCLDQVDYINSQLCDLNAFYTDISPNDAFEYLLEQHYFDIL